MYFSVYPLKKCLLYLGRDLEMYILPWQQAQHTLKNTLKNLHSVTVMYIVYIVFVFYTTSKEKIYSTMKDMDEASSHAQAVKSHHLC